MRHRDASKTEREYAIEEVRAGAEVDEAYDCLAQWFGVRGELERRQVIDGWLARPAGQTAGSVRMRYHLLVARTPEGSIAAVRDCHTTLDFETGICVAYLAHVFVNSAHRRTGLAQRLREVPLELALRDTEEWGTRPTETILALEQEAVRVDKPDTLIRLVAYGRAGFRAVDPAVMPYCQPDFSAALASGLPVRPLPLLAVVRHVGHEAEHSLPCALAKAVVQNLYAVFSTHCHERDLAPLRAHALGRLMANGRERVPLLRLPSSLDDADAIESLLETRIRAYFPEDWSRPD